jgi:hypothetical protein
MSDPVKRWFRRSALATVILATGAAGLGAASQPAHAQTCPNGYYYSYPYGCYPSDYSAYGESYDYPDYGYPSADLDLGWSGGGHDWRGGHGDFHGGFGGGMHGGFGGGMHGGGGHR